jgi:sugar O-acyltransferase (sialic acid O-acetyltransferase NeuD family)
VRDLLLIGAGGFARETAEAVRAINTVAPTWRLLGFLDDDPARRGAIVSGLPVLGTTDVVHHLRDAAVLICTGRPDNYVSRRMIAERLGLDEQRYATVVHPLASVGSTCQVGTGSVLLAHVTLTADVVVGRHVAVMPQVVLTHDVRVDNWATLGSGVRLGGSCHVAEGAYVGAGACIREGLRIGERAMIGMGAVVTRDVPDERLWYGAPARDMDRAPVPPQPRTSTAERS